MNALEVCPLCRNRVTLDCTKAAGYYTVDILCNVCGIRMVQKYSAMSGSRSEAIALTLDSWNTRVQDDTTTLIIALENKAQEYKSWAAQAVVEIDRLQARIVELEQQIKKDKEDG